VLTIKPLRIVHIDNDAGYIEDVASALDSPGVVVRSFPDSGAAMQSESAFHLQIVIYDSSGTDYVKEVLGRGLDVVRVLLSGTVTKNTPLPSEVSGTAPHEVWQKDEDWVSKLVGLTAKCRGQVTRWIDRVVYGDHVYPLRDRVAGVYSLETKEAGIVDTKLNEDFGVYGHGPDCDSALDHSLARNFHVEFQRLHSTPRVNLTSDQSRRLQRFCDLVDIRRYQQNAPLRIRAVGKIESIEPVMVRWNGRDDLSEVDLATAPAELARWGPGTWFSAHVLMDRARGVYSRVLTAELEEPLDEVLQDAGASADFVTMDDLPKGDWRDL
jgi:hypothetical protein